MKKLITILAIMIVLVGVVFAASGDKIVLSSTVAQIKPAFKIYLGEQAGTTGNGTKVTVSEDISETDIQRTFVLKQEGSLKGTTPVTYSRYKGEVTLTVTIAPFTSNLGTQATAYTILATTAAGPDVSGKLTTNDADIAEDNHSVDFKLTFLGKKLTDTEAANVGTVVAKWTADPNLLMEDTGTEYTANITLTHTTI